MGCGSSMFHRDENGGVGGPSYLYVNPLHHDFPWRRKGNPSSKDALGDTRVDEDGDPNARKSVSSAPLLPKNNGLRKEPTLQTMKEIPPTKDGRAERPVGGDRKQDNHFKDMGDDSRNVTDEKGCDREDGMAYLGSPSFRGYCASPYDIDGESSDDTGTPINEGENDSALKMEEGHNSHKDQNCLDQGDPPPKLSKSLPSSSSLRKSRRSPKRRLRSVLQKRNHMSARKNLVHGSQSKST